MSTTAQATRNRWMVWKPKARILADSAESEPTKPSEPGSVGFEGAAYVGLSEIEAELATADLELENNGMSWPEWKATALNRLFEELGTSGQPGRITAATVMHGEQHRGASMTTPATMPKLARPRSKSKIGHTADAS
jgi:hypothetical protein